MNSIYKQTMGSDFDQLHPRIQHRFGFHSEDGIAFIGEGVMERVWYAKWAYLPLQLGTLRNLLFPGSGRNIRFTVENYAYLDSFGRETVTWIRTFHFPNGKQRRFDATMIYSKQYRGIVDYLGTHQHLAVDLSLKAAPNGGIHIRSGAQRFYEGLLNFRFPRILTGNAEVIEWYDDDQDCYRIRVDVCHAVFGCIFQYQGRFQARMLPVNQVDSVPAHVKPLREEQRE